MFCLFDRLLLNVVGTRCGSDRPELPAGLDFSYYGSIFTRKMYDY